MGLLNRGESGFEGRLKRLAGWSVPLALIVMIVVPAALGDSARDLLMYDRSAIGHGEYWRLLTAHFVHLGSSHLLLNLVGLVLAWLLVGKNYAALEWIFVLMLSLIAASAGFWFIDKDMLWYVGLSGALHGLLLAGALRGLRSHLAESVLLCVLIVAKLAFEQLAGPLPGSESASDGPVAVNAHLYGAIGGLLAAAILWRRGTTTPPI
jgi:rhomboid family GlyGly-CTERM serine protease